MEFDQAHAMLSKLILHIGRIGRPVGFWEVAFKLNYSEEEVNEMLGVLEAYGMLKRCNTPDSVGFTLDARFVADTLQTLVAEDKLVTYSTGGQTFYYSPEGSQKLTEIWP